MANARFSIPAGKRKRPRDLPPGYLGTSDSRTSDPQSPVNDVFNRTGKQFPLPLDNAI